MEAYEQEDLASSQSSPNSTPPATDSEPIAEPAQSTPTEQSAPPESSSDSTWLVTKPEPVLEPAQSTSAEQNAPSNHIPKDSRRVFVAITVVAAIVAAGLSGALVYKFNSSNKSDCEVRYNNLTEEAKKKIATLKSSLADYEKRIELCEQVNENAAAINGEILNLRLAGDNTSLYINREYRFAIRVPGTFVDQMAACEINDSGAPVLSAGEGVPIAALQEASTGNFYLVAAYHYETMNADGQTGCYRIDHDVAWAQGVFGAASLAVTTGLEDVTAVQEFINQNTSNNNCSDQMQMSLVDGNDLSPKLYQLSFSSGECSLRQGNNIWYSPKLGTLFWVNYTDSSSPNIYFPDSIIVL